MPTFLPSALIMMGAKNFWKTRTLTCENTLTVITGQIYQGWQLTFDSNWNVYLLTERKKEAVVLLCGNIFITLAVTTTLYSETVLSQFCAWRLNQLLLLSSNTGKIWKGDRTRIPQTLYGGVPEQRWIIAMESLFRPEFSAGELINQATTSLSLSQAHCVYKSLKNSHFYRYE